MEILGGYEKSIPHLHALFAIPNYKVQILESSNVAFLAAFKVKMSLSNFKKILHRNT